MSYRSRLEMGQVAKVHLEKQTTFQEYAWISCGLKWSNLIAENHPTCHTLVIFFIGGSPQLHDFLQILPAFVALTLGRKHSAIRQRREAKIHEGPVEVSAEQFT